MAKLPSAFRTAEAPKRNDTSTSRERKLLDDGVYPATITGSEIQKTKSGRGEKLTVTCKLDNGAYLWPSINVAHDSPEAAEIGQRELGELCEAVGVEELQDTVQLHGKTLGLVVRTEAAKGDFKARNVVIGFRRPTGAPNVAARSPAVATKTAAAPWARKQGGAQ